MSIYALHAYHTHIHGHPHLLPSRFPNVNCHCNCEGRGGGEEHYAHSTHTSCNHFAQRKAKEEQVPHLCLDMYKYTYIYIHPYTYMYYLRTVPHLWMGPYIYIDTCEYIRINIYIHTHKIRLYFFFALGIARTKKRNWLESNCMPIISICLLVAYTHTQNTKIPLTLAFPCVQSVCGERACKALPPVIWCPLTFGPLLARVATHTCNVKSPH